MIFNNNINWDAVYDVVIIGFGGAGSVASVYAADSGSNVLLIDSAPEGKEGGNTRYSAGAFATAENEEKVKDYYLQTFYPFEHDEELLNSFVFELTQLSENLKKDFGLNPQISGMRKRGEYYEFSNSDAMIHKSATTLYDGSFWKFLKGEVYKRLNQITIWYESPAEHLIKDPETGTIIGVQVKRKDTIKNIAVKNGVVMACGGYENNPEMVQNFLGRGSLAPIGTLFNKGKGIDLAIEAGARLWHMSNFDSHVFSLNEGKEHEKFAYMIQWKPLFTGSVFISGDDGTRYINEQGEDRHGYQYNHGDYVMIPNQNHPHIVFDRNQYEDLKNSTYAKADQIRELLDHSIKADTIEELSKLINGPKLSQTVIDFNFFVDSGKDYNVDRPIDTMRKFSDGPFYAIPIRHNILHTHGGGKRNKNCEVIDLEGNIIPHLYEAGELGDQFTSKYIGGSSVADLLISGRIAGTNASINKNSKVTIDSITSASQIPEDLKSDAKVEITNFPTNANQYIGIATQGIGDLPIAVRITLDGDNIIDIETLQESETEDIGGKAIKLLTKRMLDENTYDVDGVSGASATTKGFKNAVKDALEKAKK